MTANRKIIIISIIFCLISIALIGLGIYPLFRGLNKASQELSAVKRSASSLEERAKYYDEAQIAYKKLEPDLEKLDHIFINPEFPVNIIEFWEKIALDTGASVEKISPFAIKNSDQDPWEAIGFQINIVDSFPKIWQFLDKIENSDYVVEIQDFFAKAITEDDLRFGTSQEWEIGEVSASLTIKVFTKNPPAEK